jgi:hypothetical protein
VYSVRRWVLGKRLAGKTGSDAAAVLGQGQGSDTSVILAAAGEAATQLIESVAPAIRVRTIVAPGAGGPARDAGRHGPPLLLAPGRASAQS